MCGRYYVDDETAREIEKLVRDLDRKLQIERTGDVFPSQNAMILKGGGKSSGCRTDEMGLSRV